MAGYRVLVVDDQKDIRRLLATALSSMGSALEIIEVPSAEEAMVVATRRPVDLLITDIALPGISGLELVTKFRARFPGIKIILITGMTDSRTRRQLEAADVDAYYYKPVEMTDFLAAVERQLGLESELAQPETPAPAEVQPEGKNAGVNGPSEAGSGQLAGKLAALRDRFNASAVVLVDEHGIGLAQCGDTSSLAALLPALINLQRASQDAAVQMGLSAPQNLLLVAGQGQHLALAAAGPNLLVLAGGKGFRDDLLSREGVELARAGELLAPIPQPPVSTGAPRQKKSPPPSPARSMPKPDEVSREAVEKAAAEMDKLLVGVERLPKNNLDAFWDTLAEEHPPAKTSQDVLTWEEARKLGLTHDES